MQNPFLIAALTGAGLLAANASVAGGLDTPVAEPVIQPVPTLSTFDWTGGYAGLQFGTITSDIGNRVDIFEDDYEFGTNVDGSEIGIFGGYNWQGTSPWVYGGEAEYNWVDADDDANLTVTRVTDEDGDGDPDEVEGTGTAQIDATGAIRGRVGYSFGRALLYGTAGLAYVDYEVSADVDGDEDSQSADNWGYTVGLGMDYAITDNLIGRVDYRYSDFDGDDGSFYEGDAEYDIDLDTGEFRVGLAYRF